jgi:two-component system, cell cycle response regulator DivK
MAPRVLVVEDNPVNLELLAALLEEEGCRLFTAETAAAGLRLAAGEHPELIVMDVQLPGMTGYEATRRLKADPRTATIPVVIVTAEAMRGEEAKAREAGCDAYLTKPLDTQAFRDTLRRLLGGRGTQATQTPAAD